MSRISWRVRFVLPVVGALVASSCATVGLGGESSEQSSTDPTLGTEVAEEVATGDDDAAAVEDAEPEARPSIWTRADDADLRPDLPATTFGDAAAPDENAPWTIVGSEFDYDLNRSIPVVWQVDAPQDINSWTREDLAEGPDANARLVSLDRSATGDIAVGNSGQNIDQRAAIWSRPVGGSWEQTDPATLAGDVQERLYAVATDPDGDSALAVGVRVTDSNKRVPSLWLRSSTAGGWASVPGLPFADDGSEDISGVALSADAVVLTGTAGQGTNHDAAAWVSADGQTWDRAQVEIPDDADESYLSEVVWFGEQFVAVGGVATESIYVPAAWSSVDGTDWKLEDRDFQMNDDGRSSTAGVAAHLLTIAGDRLLASANNGFMQHIWTSDDGNGWSTVDNIWDLRPDGVSIGGLTGDSEEVFIASSEPAIFYNRGEWRTAGIVRDLMPTPDSKPYVNDITATEDGWVMVGGTSFKNSQSFWTDQAVAWGSGDAMSWTDSGRLPMATLGPIADSAVDPEGGLLAVGSETTFSASQRRTFGRSIIWEGAGGTWTELQAAALVNDDRKVSMQAVTRAGSDVISGGLIFSGDNIDAMLVDSANGLEQRVDIGYDSQDNESVVALCAADDGTAAAFVEVRERSGGSTIAPLIRSATGEWSDAELQTTGVAPEKSGIFGCVYGPDGYVAAGWTRTGENEDVGLWRSQDGHSWQRVTGPSTFSTEANQWTTSITATDSGYIVAGNDTSTGQVLPVVWIGSGNDWEQVVVGDDTIDMTSAVVGFSDGVVVFVGRKNGAERVYTTTLEALEAEAAATP